MRVSANSAAIRARSPMRDSIAAAIRASLVDSPPPSRNDDQDSTSFLSPPLIRRRRLSASSAKGGGGRPENPPPLPPAPLFSALLTPRGVSVPHIPSRNASLRGVLATPGNISPIL